MPFLVGLVAAHAVTIGDHTYVIDGTRIVLFAGGLVAAVVGMLAYRQMDDRRAEPLLPDLIAALRRGDRRSGTGLLVAVEGTSADQTAEQTRRLVGWLESAGHIVDRAAGSDRGWASSGWPARCAALRSAAHGPGRSPLRPCTPILSSVVIRPSLSDGAVVVVDRFLAGPLAQFGIGPTDAPPDGPSEPPDLDPGELENLAHCGRPDGCARTSPVLLDDAPADDALRPAGAQRGGTGCSACSAGWPPPSRQRYLVVDADADAGRGSPSGSREQAVQPVARLAHGLRAARRSAARTKCRRAQECGERLGRGGRPAGRRAGAARRSPPTPSGMTHAWLFTGPPGSGRSVAARAFAAALQCADAGCGVCQACRTVLAGTHADVREVVPEGLSISVAEMRALVQLAARRPSTGRWQILLITDADRLTEGAANALLKAVEEPPERTVFLLCAPSDHPDDVPVTIRSRCRTVALRSPSVDAVAAVLVAAGRHRPGDRALGGGGRPAATSDGRPGWPDPRRPGARREQVLDIPLRLRGFAEVFAAADALIKAAEGEAAALSETRDAAEREALSVAMGAGGTGRGVAAAQRGAKAAERELERRQKSRGDPHPARRAGPGAGRSRRVLPRRAGRRRSGADGPAWPTRTAPTTSGAAAATWSPESVLRGWRPCWPAGRRSS